MDTRRLVFDIINLVVVVALVGINVGILVVDKLDRASNHNDQWIDIQVANCCLVGVMGVAFFVVVGIRRMGYLESTRQRVYISLMLVFLLLSTTYGILCIQYHQAHLKPSLQELMATNPPIVTAPFWANHNYALITILSLSVMSVLCTIAMDFADEHAIQRLVYDRQRSPESIPPHHTGIMHNIFVLGLLAPLSCLVNVSGRPHGSSGVGVNSDFLCSFSSNCPIPFQ